MAPSPSGIDLRAASNRLFRTRGGRLLYLAFASAFVLLIAYNACSVYVRPNEFGIKQVIVGSGKGIKPTVYRSGLHWVSPGIERMHVFPTDIQLLTLSNDANERQKDDNRMEPAINIQTSEGYTVTVDVTVLYRIEDPYKVFTTVGPGKLYEDQLMIPRSEQILRKRLGELDAEEFYNVAKRLEKVDMALADLNSELVPAGMRAVNIFVRRYVYDDRYQHAIEQRKIQDQTVFKNQAAAELATATAEKDRIVAVGEAQVKVELARGDAEKRKVMAQADLYERTQRAQGELQVKLAEAEGTRLENDALRGVGSENMVGLKMADALKSTKLIVVPTDGANGMNPLDLNGALKHFDVKQ